MSSEKPPLYSVPVDANDSEEEDDAFKRRRTWDEKIFSAKANCPTLRTMFCWPCTKSKAYLAEENGTPCCLKLLYVILIWLLFLLFGVALVFQLYHIFDTLRTQYFTFWTAWINKRCEMHDLTDDCCDEVLLLVHDNRWKIYLLCTLAFCVGLGIFAFGQNVKSRPQRYWSAFCQAAGTLFLWDSYSNTVDVTAELKDTVQELFDAAAGPIGKGHDGDWANHKKLTVIRVERLENGRLWTAYKRTLRQTAVVSEVIQKVPKDFQEAAQKAIDHVQSLQTRWSSKSKKVEKFLQSLRIDSSRNEVLLFHGAPKIGARDKSTNYQEVLFKTCSPLDAIKNLGFDSRLGNTSGMLGSGMYFADKTTKADQYAGKYGGPDETTVGEEACLFLSRVALGMVYPTDVSLHEMRRPPSLRGNFDASLAWATVPTQFGESKPWVEKGVKLKMCDHRRYDSVMTQPAHDEKGRVYAKIDDKARIYFEYAVFGQSAYPEFAVTYKRE